MAWFPPGESAIFRHHLSAMLEPTTPAATVPKWNDPAEDYYVALYDDTITPDRAATVAAGSYGGADWPTATGEVSDAAGWPAGGLPLDRTMPGTGFDSSGGNIVFGGEDLPSSNLVSLADVFGDLLYDNSLVPIKGGAAFHYFGGAQQVTQGTFTIVWATGPTGGVMRVEVG
jgi:hypothetical protein